MEGIGMITMLLGLISLCLLISYTTMSSITYVNVPMTFVSVASQQNLFLKEAKIGALWRIASVLLAADFFRFMCLFMMWTGCCRKLRGGCRGVPLISRRKIEKMSNAEELLSRTGGTDSDIQAYQDWILNEYYVQLLVKGIGLVILLYFSNQTLSEMNARVEYYRWDIEAIDVRENFTHYINIMQIGEYLVWGCVGVLALNAVNVLHERGRLEGTKVH
eukprot:GHVR01014176.1.p1 GENE.GHVR01014176.1~~GHVR01014176.1.p1  ORF type:complete len:218 (+),score=30.36 GHVR01014176.1:121-774(+)